MYNCSYNHATHKIKRFTRSFLYIVGRLLFPRILLKFIIFFLNVFNVYVNAL